MEKTFEHERREIHALLGQALRENDYADWTAGDLDDALKAASE